MNELLKRLPESLHPKGTGIPGLTANLVQRTEKVAWYVRNDGYYEVFVIQTGLSFDKSVMQEFYPSNDDFGKTAICTRFVETAAQEYANLWSGSTLDEQPDTKRHQVTTRKKKRKIRRPQLQLQDD